VNETLFVRHGETTWNATGRIQGWAPVPLSDRGRRQADSVAAAVIEGRQSVDAVVSSDLPRATATAEPVAEAAGVEVETDRRLRERDFGAYQGLDAEGFFDRFPEMDLLNESTDAAAYTPESGESWLDVRERVLAAATELRDRDERTVVVTHRNPVLLVIGEARGLDLVDALTDGSAANCSITRIDADGRVTHATETGHLDRER